MRVKFAKLRPDIQLPEYQSEGAAGMDLRVALPGMGEHLAPGEIKIFSTGLAVEIPFGWELQVRSRSGLASRGIAVANGIGTIDSDYRGEIKVILHNVGTSGEMFFHGDRIAQLVPSRVERIEWSNEEELKPTKRGKLGLGSTNKD